MIDGHKMPWYTNRAKEKALRVMLSFGRQTSQERHRKQPAISNERRSSYPSAHAGYCVICKHSLSRPVVKCKEFFK